jgi:hypothetical protein
MNELPYWVQYVQALGPAVVAIIAALIAGYIAWRQWRTANYRLSLDLYEKRSRVYVATHNFLVTAINQRGVSGDDYRALFNGLQGAEFLFDKETTSYLKNIRDKAWKAQAIGHRLDQSQPDEQEGILKFFLEQSDALEEMFRPYLDLSKSGLKSYWPWG